MKKILRQPDYIILVHGTFAHNAPWIHSDSPLTKLLKAEYASVQVIPFNWTGANSHVARKTAGNDLAVEIEKLATTRPRGKIALIGHSHGGNVIRYAINDLGKVARRQVKNIVFLGTPFIDIRRRSSLQFSVETAAAVITVLLHIQVAVFFVVFGLSNKFHSETISTITLIYWAFLYFLTQHRYITNESGKEDTRKIRVKIKNYLLVRLNAANYVIQNKIGFAPLTVPSLACKIAFDEAGLSLKFLDYFASVFLGVQSLPLLMLSWFWRLIVVSWIIAELSLLVLDSELFAHNIFWIATYAPRFSILAAPATLVLCIITQVIIKAHRFGYGWEGLFTFLHTKIDTTLLPMTTADAPAMRYVFTVTGKWNFKNLRHSYYYDALGQWPPILNWLRSSSEHKDTLSLPEPTTIPSRTRVVARNWIIPAITAGALAAAMNYMKFDAEKWMSGDRMLEVEFENIAQRTDTATKVLYDGEIDVANDEYQVLDYILPILSHTESNPTEVCYLLANYESKYGLLLLITRLC